MEIIKFEQLENRLIKYDGCLVLLDRDVLELYNVPTKEINQALSNNKKKFPDGYIVELTKEEKKEQVKKFDWFSKLNHFMVNRKLFTEKGLYMFVTIIKSEVL